jgi:hypothetical protein
MDDIESIYNGYVLILMLIGFIGVIVAFIPTYIAFGRKNPYKWIILIINIFIGWTGIGWLILLIYTLFPKKRTIVDPILDPTGTMSAKAYGDRMNDFKTHSNKFSSLKELYELKKTGAISDQEFQDYRNNLK